VQHSSWLGLASVPGALETRPAVLMKKEDVQPQEKEEEELEEELPCKPVPKKSLFEVNISSVFSLYQRVKVHTGVGDP
jgi:hypothetical protein